MASNLCGKFYFDGGTRVIGIFDTRSFESIEVGEQIPFSS
jgi:hypothetical protein